ncbi:hypothetical protein RHGRI_038126 [Rhododendron griersonianum]|uniref:Gfo/Idh/MocA-like oxidoreductase C-terminal domain-containing protein n=1 Tax=Rhododendron griersonianum TaxID=479676 RepID=A0AAV6HUH1_9ERIC|nr:hypothetical protein RHGRI_038126 [Rhododendron griersonianum]
MTNPPPQIAIIGAGTFVKTQYLPRLAEISDLVVVKAIWSRSEESARGAVEIGRKIFPEVECKWGETGLDEIIQDSSIVAVAVVLAGQTQALSLSLSKLLCIQKSTFVYYWLPFELTFVLFWHASNFALANMVDIEEKPAAASTSEAETALSSYNSTFGTLPGQPIWAVAENYRFEPALVEGKKLVAEIGEMMSVQVIAEGSMNSSNPYFSSSWRRNFTGGFVLDMGVHYVAGLRMQLVGCEIKTVSAFTSHVDLTLPPPDNISSALQIDWLVFFSSLVNWRMGVREFLCWWYRQNHPRHVIFWRIVGVKGTVQLERGNREGKHGYMVSLYTSDGQNKCTFYPFSGVTEEFKAFINDFSQATLKKGKSFEPEPRCSFVEGARDVAVLEAMLESGMREGALVQVKRF